MRENTHRGKQMREPIWSKRKNLLKIPPKKTPAYFGPNQDKDDYRRPKQTAVASADASCHDQPKDNANQTPTILIKSLRAPTNRARTLGVQLTVTTTILQLNSFL